MYATERLDRLDKCARYKPLDFRSVSLEDFEENIGTFIESSQGARRFPRYLTTTVVADTF